MAGDTILIKIGGLVVRIGGSLIFASVTRNTVAHGTGKLRAMAGNALEISVSALKPEFGRMFIADVVPGISRQAMARLALI